MERILWVVHLALQVAHLSWPLPHPISSSTLLSSLLRTSGSGGERAGCGVHIGMILSRLRPAPRSGLGLGGEEAESGTDICTTSSRSGLESE